MSDAGVDLSYLFRSETEDYWMRIRHDQSRRYPGDDDRTRR